MNQVGGMLAQAYGHNDGCMCKVVESKSGCTGCFWLPADAVSEADVDTLAHAGVTDLFTHMGLLQHLVAQVSPVLLKQVRYCVKI